MDCSPSASRYLPFREERWPSTLLISLRMRAKNQLGSTHGWDRENVDEWLDKFTDFPRINALLKPTEEDQRIVSQLTTGRVNHISMRWYYPTKQDGVPDEVMETHMKGGSSSTPGIVKS
ncbi:hypothetical protein I7I51_03218 [Histoplasma capsulatum]|uniref:Uncharacterized protein n=1 Tax=Ajellomyces capsulatus TaxID=5037 RepID=A0A8A1MKI9_AJECA|nr:hypothetical protein I7I51_03218 [Histoplasma capsulatum]